MANEVRSTIDPFGNTIFLLQDICISHNLTEENEIYDDAATVISKPALVIEVKVDGPPELYYFRSVGWDSTMLITAHLHNERWETSNCVRNPSNEALSDLMRKGIQLL